MIITLSTGPNDAASTTWPATDLGYLLHKHPDRLQSFDLSVGTAYVFYPEATAERCTVALLLEVDPVGLVRGQRAGAGPEAFALGQYVNDRPYAASSMMSHGADQDVPHRDDRRCDARPELAARRSLGWRSRCPRCRAGAAPTWPARCSSRSAGTVDGHADPAGPEPSRTGATRATSTCG